LNTKNTGWDPLKANNEIIGFGHRVMGFWNFLCELCIVRVAGVRTGGGEVTQVWFLNGQTSFAFRRDINS